MEPLGDNLLINSVLFCVSLGFCALFSFLETSITALRLFKLKELAESSSHYKILFQSLELNPNRLLNTILIAHNLADVTAATLGTILMEQFFSNLPGSIGFSLGIFITTATLLIFGEVIPKNIAKIYGERLFSSTLWITNIIFYALHPFVTILMNIADYIVHKIGGEKPHAGEFITSEKEIQFLIDYINEKGLMVTEKTSMLKSIFELGTTPVKEIMVPETSMISIRADASMSEARHYFNQYQFSRFPVYEGSLNNVIGMLHIKDVFTILSQGQERFVKEIMRPILFIPESIKVNQLLKEFKDQRMHIAIVINEYGGTIGLVTLEDVLEEIVGEIRDEYETVTEKIVPLKQGSWIVDASIELEELHNLLGISFESEDALTLGGFMTERLQHLPKKGERLIYKNFTFQVQQASEKKVFQVIIFSDSSHVSLENI